MGKSTPEKEADRLFWQGGKYQLDKKIQKAAECYQKAAALGHAQAKVRLGDIYCSGEWTLFGFPRDIPKGLQFYREAAECGSNEAQKKLEKIDRCNN